MPLKAKPDEYANVAYAAVTCSAINTLTFEPIRFAVGLFQGVGIVVHRILYYPTGPSLRELVAATDGLVMALTSSNRLTNIEDISEPAILDRISIVSVGVAVEPHTLPYTTDWSTLPGGGKIFPANPLWVAITTTGAVAASALYFQLDFTFKELTDKDYLELMQSMLPANI